MNSYDLLSEIKKKKEKKKKNNHTVYDYECHSHGLCVCDGQHPLRGHCYSHQLPKW